MWFFAVLIVFTDLHCSLFSFVTTQTWSRIWCILFAAKRLVWFSHSSSNNRMIQWIQFQFALFLFEIFVFSHANDQFPSVASYPMFASLSYILHFNWTGRYFQKHHISAVSCGQVFADIAVLLTCTRCPSVYHHRVNRGLCSCMLIVPGVGM